MKKAFTAALFALVLGLSVTAAQEIPAKAWNSGTWEPGKILLVSGNQRYQLVFYNDGSLAIRHMTAEGPINFWRIETKEPDSYVSFQEDGNLVIYQNDSSVLWASNSGGRNGEALFLMNTGNLVIHAPGAEVVWESGKYWAPNRAWMPTDATVSSWTPGEIVVRSDNGHYQLEFQYDGNLVLYHRYTDSKVAIWSSDTYNKGADNLTFVPQLKGMFVRQGNKTLWRTPVISEFECLYLEDSGNMMIHAPGARIMWETGTAGK